LFNDNTVKGGFIFGLVSICLGVGFFFLGEYDLSTGFTIGGIIMWFILRVYSKADPALVNDRRTD